jgi:hypothetical protein
MIQGTERFTIHVTEEGVRICSAEGRELQFTASEALMLLDILKQEEIALRRTAAEASPLPFRICMNDGSDQGP